MKRSTIRRFLYKSSWERAVEEYRQVIERQPLLIELRLKLGKILQLIGQDSEAIAVYESALPIAQNEPTRQHIRGAIAVCIGDSQGAIAAFESAATLEPDNVAHWLALGQVHMAKEDAIAALRAFDAVLSLDSEGFQGQTSESGRLLQLPKSGELIKGDDVRQLQQALIAAGFTLQADGVFGEGTAQAIKKFQEQQGLPADGIAGAKTFVKLGIDLKSL